MTQSDRFAARFAVLAQKKEGAFVPFVNLCDPTPEISSQILEALAAGGADALELGIPFSDPCADGPVIEASAQRALNDRQMSGNYQSVPRKTPGYSSEPYALCKPRDSARRRKLLCGRQGCRR